MRASFDTRVVAEWVLELVRACQRHGSVTLGGGAALAGAHLAHRLSRDVDLVCHDADELTVVAALLPQVAAEVGAQLRVVRHTPTFLRATATHPDGTTELDLVYESAAPLAPPDVLAGVALESLPDLRACKLTCLLSRAEPRDLVDVLFLERAGFPPEQDLPLALRKDAGMDPGVLAWLLGDFPVRPLPSMLAALSEQELIHYRDTLRERLRLLALPAE